MDTKKRSKWVFLSLLTIFVMTFTIVACLFVQGFTNSDIDSPTQTEEKDEEGVEEEPLGESKVEPKEINFQSIIDEWVAATSGNKSILIYDLDLDKIVGSYNTEESYNTASLYKLFVAYEGYRRIQSGEWDANEEIGWTGHTRIECLDLAIRESYSPCAEALWSEIGHEELDIIIANDFKITDSNISGLTSNANDIFKIMKLFYEHPDFTDETLVARMKDSFLSQPTTTYDWRQGFPSGFSDRTLVYNKVGWDYNPDGNYWNIYHDVAIIEFPIENRHYIAVVMTNKISNVKIRELGTAIENYFYNNQE